jgi:hypothetical protein
VKRDAVIGFPSIERLLRQQLGNVSNRALAGSALPRMLLFSLVVGSFGCSVVSSKGSWGGNWSPFTDIGSAAADAAKDPQTWVPLVGAALLYVDDFDEKLSKSRKPSTCIWLER